MKVKEKKVYYCDFCKKHGLSAGSMARHEKTCTANINRECHWNDSWRSNLSGSAMHQRESLPKRLAIFKRVKTIKERHIEDLREAVYYCPACMLTVIRCSGRGREMYGLWNYTDEVEAFNEELRRREEEETISDVMMGWI